MLVSSCRDTLELQVVLRSWDVYVAAAGQLEPWVGQELRAALHQNNLWCRPNAKRPWALDVTIGEGDGDAWIYRRDPRVRVPWDIAVLHTLEGVPCLAPELQLLYKSKAPRERDDFDAEQVVPELDDGGTSDSHSCCQRDIPWRRLLRAST